MPSFFSLPPRPRRASSERGAAIVLVISMMLVLTAIGISSLQSASREQIISINRTYAFQAGQVAKAAIHMTANYLIDRGNDFVVVILNKTGTGANECDQNRVLCLTAASFYPRGAAKVNNRAFRLDALSAHIPSNFATANAGLNATGDAGRGFPVLQPDFRVRISDPVKAVFSAPLAGYSTEQPTLCTYTLTLTATGWVRKSDDPGYSALGAAPAPTSVVAEKIYRAYINVLATGDRLCN